MLETIVMVALGVAFKYLVDKLDRIEMEVTELMEKMIRMEEKNSA
jgi:hypothetical protein